MLRFAPRFFTALGLRISRAARLLAAPISGWRGWGRPRRRRGIYPGLEFLEHRELLSSTPGLPDLPAILGDMRQLRDDFMTSATTLVNTVTPSQPNLSSLIRLENQEAQAWNTQLNSVLGWPTSPAILGDMRQFHDDLMTSATTLDHTITQSQPNLPSLLRLENQEAQAWNTLTADRGKLGQDMVSQELAPILTPLNQAIDQADQRFSQFVSVAQEMWGTLLDGLDRQLGLLPSSSTTPLTSNSNPTSNDATSEASAQSNGVSEAAASEPAGNALPAPRMSGIITPLFLASPSVSQAPQATPSVNQPPQVTSVITLTSSADSIFLGQSVTFTATVDDASGSGTPTGSVTFYDGGTELGSSTLGANGVPNQATFSTTALTIGNHSIRAVYGGDATYATSSVSRIEAVVPIFTSLSLSSSGDTAPGQPQTLTATVSAASLSGTPTGTITFYDGSASLGSATLNYNAADGHYEAVLTTSALTNLGGHNLMAVYSGDSNYAGSVGVLTEIVGLEPTLLNLSSSSSETAPGQPLTLTATLSGAGSGTPTGTITFYDGSASLGSATLNYNAANGHYEAVLTTSALTNLGGHNLMAVYSGDNAYAGSVGVLTQWVVLNATSLSLSSSSSQPQPGQSITFTATVSATGAPSGTVDFYNGQASLGSAPLNYDTTSQQYQAVLTTSLPTAGTSDITAIYSGDSTFASSSSFMSQAVAGTSTGQSTSLSLSSSADPSSPNQSVAFTAVVSGSVSGGSSGGSGGTSGGGSSGGSGGTSGGGTSGGSGGSSGGGTSGGGTSGGSGGGTSGGSGGTSGGSGGGTSGGSGGGASGGGTSGGSGGGTSGGSGGTNSSLTGGLSGSITGSYLGSLGGDLSGSFSGSLTGSVSDGTNSGILSGSFTGSLTGSISTSGYLTGTFSASGTFTISGTISGSGQLSVSGSLSGLTVGDPSGNVQGSLSGSIAASILGFISDSGSFSGSLSGNGDSISLSSGGDGSGTTTGSLSGSDSGSDASGGSGGTSGGGTSGGGTSGGGTSGGSGGTSGGGTSGGSGGSSDGGASGGGTSGGSGGTSGGSGGTSGGGLSGGSDSSSAFNSFMSSNTFSDSNSSGGSSDVMPTGTVDFYDGQTKISTGALSDISGQDEATWTTATLSLGSHEITAIYSGDSTFLASTANLLQEVNQSTTSVQLTSSLNPSAHDQAVTFTAAVSGNASGGGTPTGTVTFYDGATTLGSGTLSIVAGQDEATWTTDTLALGDHEITAVYNGDTTFLASATTLPQTVVNQSSSSVQLLSSVDPSASGEMTTFTAVLSGSASGGATPTGTVTFYDGSTSLGSGTLGIVNGQDEAALQTASLTLGEHDITAVYGGDAIFFTSTATLVQSVVPPSWQGGGPTFTWTQTTVAAPSVVTPAAQANTENDTVSLQVQASDPNGYPLSYAALDLPSGLSIDSSTGLISGTVAYGDAAAFDGTYNPIIIVANNQGGSTQTSFSWTISPAQVAPVLSNPGSQSNVPGDNVSLQVSATQINSDPISYEASNLPDGLSIDPETGLLSGTVAADAVSNTPYAVTLTATDDSTGLSANQSFNWTITPSTAAPVWTDPGAQSNDVGDAVYLQLSAEDANDDALTYTASGLPTGLTLDPIAGTITGTLPAAAASSTPYNVTVTASNGSSSSNQTFQWTVNPISLQNPGDQSNLNGDSVSLPVMASDVSNGTLSYSATGLPPGLSVNSGSGVISGTISASADTNSPYSVTVTASDGSNSASQTFNWTVAAVALKPINDQQSQEGTTVSLQVSADDNVGTPTYSAAGLPPGVSINSTTGLISGTVGLGAFGSSPYQVTVTATDGSNTSSQSFVWTVTPRVALVNPGPQSNATGDNVALPVSATSPGGTMSYSATGLPDGLSINSSTGLISGTVAADAASSTPYNVTVTANDGTSTSSQTFQWTVSVINVPSPGDQTNDDGDAVSLPLSTGYHGSGALSYSATGLPPGLSIISTTGQITGTIAATADTDSPYAVKVTATNGTNTSTQTFNWTVNAVVSVDAIDEQSKADGDTVSLPVSASDALNNTLSYSTTGLPPGLSINGSTGLISGTISAGADTSSPYAVTVTATDSAGLSASQSFNWNVASVGLVNPDAQASVDGQAVSLQLQGSSGATYSATGLPSGVSINSSTGLISGTLASNADTAGPYVVTATATLGGNSSSQMFVWTVTSIGLAAVSDQTNSEGDNVSLQLQGLANGGSLTYSASGLPNGLSLNPTMGLITGTIAAGDAANGPYTVDVAVSNGTVSASQSFTWNINPIVNLTTPADQTNTEGDNVSLQMTATEALNNTLTYSADGLPSGLGINSTTGLISGTIATGDFGGGPYTVTVTASDGTYNSSQTFTWNIRQANPTTPTLTNLGPQTNVAGDSVNLPINASDADGDALTYSAINLPDGLSIDPNSGVISGILAEDAPDPTPYQVTVTATDGNGISASQTFSWLVNAPALNAQGVLVNAVEGVDPGSFTVATFTTPDLNSLADDFTATIDFGDGGTDAGVISGSNGSFTVTADYIYAKPGTYTVTVQVDDSQTGGSAVATTTATVTVAPLTVTGGFDSGAVQQQATPLTLATFMSANPNLTASDFSATVDWGDGSGVQPVTVIDSGDGLFSVVGSHAYAQNGTYTTVITISGDEGDTASTASTVTVGNLIAGLSSKLTVASFTDLDPSLSASNFTATIDWGDGTQSSGTVVGGNGTFQVQGTHTYAQDSIDQPDGVYTVTVTVSDVSGDTLTSGSAVAVVRPQLSLSVADVNLASSLTVNNAPVATFSDPDASDSAGEFQAQIAWGDGSTSSGTIQEVSPGLFVVLGSHTYASSDWYTMTVTVLQGWGGMAANAEGAGLAADDPKVQIWAYPLKPVGGRNLFQEVQTLEVSRWDNAFTRVQTKPPQFHKTFINANDQRFFVRVFDPVAYKNAKSIKVYVETSSDTGQEITLTRDLAAGWFKSAPLLLTTFAVDKQAESGQAFHVKLGDTIKATYDQLDAEATVPVQKIVHLSINILRVTNGGDPVTTITDVKGDYYIANRIYAAAGIRFVIDRIRYVNPPAGVDLDSNGKKGLESHFFAFPVNQLQVNVNGQLKYRMTNEEKDLLDAWHANPNTAISVYYVNFFSDKNGAKQQLFGESFTVGKALETKYSNSIIIGADTEQYQTLAHEIGHVLLNSGSHSPSLVNLMFGSGTRGDALPLVAGRETDSRRLTEPQSEAMQKNRLSTSPPKE